MKLIESVEQNKEKTAAEKLSGFRKIVTEYFMLVSPIQIVDISEVRNKAKEMTNRGDNLDDCPLEGLVITKDFEMYSAWVRHQILLAVSLPSSTEQVIANEFFTKSMRGRPIVNSVVFFSGNKSMITSDGTTKCWEGNQFNPSQSSGGYWGGNWFNALQLAGEYMNHLHDASGYFIGIPSIWDFLMINWK